MQKITKIPTGLYLRIWVSTCAQLYLYPLSRIQCVLQPVTPCYNPRILTLNLKLAGILSNGYKSPVLEAKYPKVFTLQVWVSTCGQA